MNEVELSSMILKNENEDYFICKACGYQAKRRSSVKRHLLTIHQALHIECEICKKVYKHQKSFNRHACMKGTAMYGKLWK